MKSYVIKAMTASVLLAAQGLPAADIGHGEKLHTASCTSCHDDSIYTRPNRRVTTLDGLHKQVRRCELSLGLKWFDTDIDDVAAWLNQNYYRYE
jgi:cytochrome c553